ncbi:peptidoglycan recognition protein family protein [Burkholderia ubonensis]|uniref:peptidoglycan recognition protein family protein n=1 Tax=Burkholderia ubonensis TaxID=101571 RepID=UPI000F57013D|nr:peptidoglycan recognition family protein [Burkholderia ubonensis]RQP31006.1 N-acetylmuramoyl-L-alanine amidase [Burkholderia ubonensis]RQP33986.1 N-acetylmuramoyl-L-alanine amidase [Burkholderia ubonensis]RQP36813.1 N-acetylmuramoyl-L-alanine amidase [Burkholderia ubonensis]RQP51384.1 N-acetylmuramoyl-L-alanine amidase [Burkholderia ubonensis]RQP56479.1 N-acetylmuramoyl-L-alanine amidase [Burkholderia ubonensis]
MLFISKQGHVDAERIQVKIFSEIERSPMSKVNGIVVHQTDSPTAESTFNSYRKKGANGAHFLIDKDGTIYQTASLLKRTNHVGKLKSRCIITHECPAAELKIASGMEHKYTKLSSHEHKKTWPNRYPSNNDSIGIELVGEAHDKDISGTNRKEKVYESVTEQQNSSLQWLIKELTETLYISSQEIYRHPQLSYKTPTEAATAKW